MKVLAPAILCFEALLVALAIPVSLTVGDGTARTAWVLAGLAILLVLAAGMSRGRHGVAIGWVMQVLVLVAGLLLPALAVVGLMFLGVWVVAVVYGGKADRIAASRAARGTAPGAASEGGPTTP
jgi:Protein of unknown function (DUF4233)